MKTIENVINSNINNKLTDNIITLENLEDNIKNKLSNIDGYKINECCCDCGCCGEEKKCCDLNTTVLSTPGSGMPPYENLSFYCNECEIVNILKTGAVVQTMYNLHKQFGNKFKYLGESPKDTREPLYFKEYLPDQYMDLINGSYDRLNNNKKLYDFIKDICSNNIIGYPVVLDRIDKKIQIFFVASTGSKNNEFNVKNALETMVDLLNDFEDYDEIEWSQIIDISLDIKNDWYSFVISIVCDEMYFKE